MPNPNENIFTTAGADAGRSGVKNGDLLARGVEFDARLTSPPTDVEAFGAHIDLVADELAKRGVTDPFVAAEGSTGKFHIALVIEADSEIDAIQAALGTIRSAIHAAGSGTPGWGGWRIDSVCPAREPVTA